MPKYQYVYTQELVREVMVLSELDDLVESVREYAFPEVLEEKGNPGRIVGVKITVEADDLWELRTAVEDTRNNVESYEHALKRPILPLDREYVHEEA